MGISADGTGVYPYVQGPKFRTGQTVRRTKEMAGILDECETKNLKGYTFEIKSIMKGPFSGYYYYVCPKGITHLEKHLEEVSISWE
jgi:hypothetical protein